MSQENVELIKAALEAWNAHDMDAVRETLDPDVVVRLPEGWPEPGPFVGREAVMHQWGRNRETWDVDTLEPVAIIDAGDRVVVRLLWKALSRGPEAQMELTAIYTIRNGKTSYQESFWDHGEALEAVGLSEQATSHGNVDRLRRIHQEFFDCRRVRPELLAADVEWVNPSDAVEPGRRRGADSFNEAIGSVFDAWDDAHFEIERLIDNGNEVVALGQVRGRGRAARIEVVRPHGEIWTFRDGKVIRMRWFHSHRETLEAASLSEQDAHADS